MCRYFSKFGENCRYKHVTPQSNTVTNTIHLVAQLNSLEKQIKIMSNKIINLEKEINRFKKTSPTTIICKWDECGYEASSEPVLKRHMTTKHKQNSKTSEKSRDSDLDDTLKLSPFNEEIRDTLTIPSYEEGTVNEVQLKCRYWTCQFSSYDKKELENHIDIKHAVDESFIYPSSSEEWECPECDQLFMADHTFARHVYEEHFYSFTCTHCNKHLPGEDEMAGIH